MTQKKPRDPKIGLDSSCQATIKEKRALVARAAADSSLNPNFPSTSTYAFANSIITTIKSAHLLSSQSSAPYSHSIHNSTKVKHSLKYKSEILSIALRVCF